MALLNLSIILTVHWIRAETALFTDKLEELTKFEIPGNLTISPGFEDLTQLSRQIAQLDTLPDRSLIEELYLRVLQLERDINQKF